MKNPIDRRTLGLGIIPTYSDDDNSLLLEGSRAAADVRAAATLVNSTVEATLATLPVPTTVVSGDIVRVVIFADFLNNSGSTCTYTFKMALGSTTVLTGFSSQLSAAGRRALRIEFDLLVVNPANSQIVSGSILTAPNTVNNAATWTGGGAVGVGTATAAEDLTAGKNIAFLATANVANALTDVVLRAATLAVIKRGATT